MKINGLIDHPRWYDIPCKCNHDSIETEYPIAECLHCQFQAQEDSMPREDFEINEIKFTVDEDGNTNEDKQKKVIREINIVRGQKYEEIIGWTF